MDTWCVEFKKDAAGQYGSIHVKVKADNRNKAVTKGCKEARRHRDQLISCYKAESAGGGTLQG